MGQTLSDSDKLKLAYVAEKEAADKLRAEHQEYFWDRQSNGPVSVIGRTRRYDRKDNSVFLFNTSTLHAMLPKSSTPGLWSSMMATIGAYRNWLFPPTFNLSENFKLEAQYVSDEFADELNTKANLLKKAFENPAACEHSLREQIQKNHGIVFCKSLNKFTICAQELAELGREFERIHGAGSVQGSNHIHVFRAVAQTHTIRPDRCCITGERAPAYHHV